VVTGVSVSSYTANYPTTEDTFAVQTQLPQVGGALFGVFDGHCGDWCSAFARRDLFGE